MHDIRYEIWHLKIFSGTHGDSDISDASIDGIFRTFTRLVAEHYLLIPFVWKEISIAVMGDESSKSFSHIQKLEFRPEIHETVCRWRARQSDDAFN